MGNKISNVVGVAAAADDDDTVASVPLCIMPKHASSIELDMQEIKNLFELCRVLPICVIASIWHFDVDNLERISKLVSQHDIATLITDIDNVASIVQWLRYVIKLNEVEKSALNGGAAAASSVIEDDEDIEVILDNAARIKRQECEAHRDKRQLVSTFLSKLYYVCLDLSFKRGAAAAVTSTAFIHPGQRNQRHQIRPTTMAAAAEPPPPPEQHQRSQSSAGLSQPESKRMRRAPLEGPTLEGERYLSLASAAQVQSPLMMESPMLRSQQ